MEKEFLEYTEALELKELGFDEPCFGYYNGHNEFVFFGDIRHCTTNSEFGFYPTAPTFSQAFRWFREKYGLLHDITLTVNINYELESFYILIHKLNGLVINEEDDDIELNVKTTNKEEAELACLKKLIQIVKTKQHEIQTNTNSDQRRTSL